MSRHTPKNFGVAPSPPPPFPGGVAPKFGPEKVSRYTGVSQVQLRVSRYTVQLRSSSQKDSSKAIVRVLVGTRVLRRVLNSGGVTEGAWRVLRRQKGAVSQSTIDDRQITHLICVRLKHLLYDFLRGILGLLHKKNNRKEAQNTPKKVI